MCLKIRPRNSATWPAALKTEKLGEGGQSRGVCACVRGKPEAGGSQTKVREGWEECEEDEEEWEAVPRQTAGKES